MQVFGGFFNKVKLVSDQEVQEAKEREEVFVTDAVIVVVGGGVVFWLFLLYF